VGPAGSSLRCSHISRQDVDFYATFWRSKASIYGSPAVGGGDGQRRSSLTNGANPTKGMGLVGVPCGTVPSLKCQVFRAELAPLTANFKLRTSNFICAKRTQFGPAGGQNAQNKPKLGRTGVCGRRSSRGSRPGREVTAQNEPNLWAGGPRIADWRLGIEGRRAGTLALRRAETYETNPISRLRIGDCGLRIGRRRPQAAGGGKMRRTKPIWAGRKVNAQNKANLATGELTLSNVVKGSYGRFACDVPLKNKANFWPGSRWGNTLAGGTDKLVCRCLPSRGSPRTNKFVRATRAHPRLLPRNGRN
jgi:hypothetical protein